MAVKTIISKIPQLGLLAMLIPLLMSAQNPSNQEVSWKFESKALSEILGQVKGGIPLHFLYHEADLPQTQLSIDFQGTDLDQALAQLVSGTGLADMF